MKKLMALLLCLVTVFLAGCSLEGNVPKSKTPESASKIVAKGDGFEVYLVRTEGSGKYSYKITARSGEVLEDAVCSEEPVIKRINDNLLGVRFTADSRSFVRYYDLKNGYVSQSYFGAFWDNGTLVALNHFAADGRLIVQNIFSPSQYRYETVIDSNALELIVTKIEESEDNTELEVTYKLGEHSSEESITLPLC